jgi:WhiB family transcriptional regulator, redox-sensing transcriptional regulator
VTREEFGPTMEADAVRYHLQALAAAGVSPAAVAALLDLPGASAHFLREVRRGAVDRINYGVGSAVLAVKVPADDRPTAWAERAECRKPWVHLLARSHGCATAVEMFFAVSTQGSRRPSAVQESALTVCRVCAVRDECLEYALAAPTHLPEEGVWGGTTDKERQKMTRRKR